MEEMDQAYKASRRRKKLIAGAGFLAGLLILGGVALYSVGKTAAGSVLPEIVKDSLASVSNVDLDEIPTVNDLIIETAIVSAIESANNNKSEAVPLSLIAAATTWPAGPNSAIETQRMGSAFGPALAVTADGSGASLDKLATGFAPTGPTSEVGAITRFDANAECTLRPVGSNEKLINVHIASSERPAPLQALNDARILADIETAAKETIARGLPFGGINAQRGMFGAIDLIVTDTTAPLYLSLHSHGRKYWRIHTAPGVTIAHIALISNGASAVTGDIGDASVEALRARDWGNQENFYHDRRAPEDIACMARPFRKPDETWAAWAGAEAGNTIDGNLLFGQDKGFDAFEYWFLQTLGVSSQTNMISAYHASAVLIGDPPASPLVLSADPSPVRIVAHDHVLTGAPALREAQLVKMYENAVSAAAGVDWNDVLPAPVTMTTDAAAEQSQISGSRRTLADHTMGTNDIEERTDLTAFNAARQVRVTAQIAVSDLLADGEEVPPDAAEETYLLLRAAPHLMAYCRDTVAEIAQKCRISSLSVGRKVTDGVYSVTASFDYIPNYTIGNIERIRQGDFLSYSVVKEEDGQSFQTPDERRAFLLELKNICTQLRAEFGNCLISRAIFRQMPPIELIGRSRPDEAVGVVEVYGLDNPFAQKKFEERVEELLTASQN